MAARTPEDRLHPGTRMGTLELLVADLPTMLSFYVDGVGLVPLSDDGGRVVLGFPGGGGAASAGPRPVISLSHSPGLRPASGRSAGLFHTAILFPSQRELARALVSMFTGYATSYVGAGDHLVSEAFYFTDPEGNGVELYADRPRELWEWKDGRVAMATLHLDPLRFVRTHAPAGAAEGPAAAGALGHVHLQVGDIPAARAFYVDALGFDETATYHDQALFVSAGGYHHHMAMNTWRSLGAGKRASTLGMGVVDITLPGGPDVDAVRDRLAVHGIVGAFDGATLTVRDPWDNRVRLGPAA